VLFLGVVTNADGCVFCCDDTCVTTPTPTPAFDVQGRRVYEVKNGQFIIVVEGAAGASLAAPGKSLQPVAPSNRPDLQIQNTRDMGNGSSQVCDTGPASSGGGGIPGINPASFAPGNPTISDALNDFACRFDPFVSASSPCTIKDPGREPKTIMTDATAQFCDVVTTTAEFPTGESVVTVKLRDVIGNLGPTAEIVVRVATLAPTPTRTASRTASRTPTLTATRTPTRTP